MTNFSVFTVPPSLIQCKDCLVKGEVLEVTEQHKDMAAKALKKFNSESNHTNYFSVLKVEKVLKTVSGILSSNYLQMTFWEQIQKHRPRTQILLGSEILHVTSQHK